MMLRSIAAALLAAPLLVCAQDAAKDAPKPAAKPAAKAPAKAGAQTAVAHVNGIAVPASRMEFMMEQQRSRGAPDNQQARTMMREELVNREVVAQEAQKSGLAKSSEVATQMDIARQEILVGAYLRDWAKKHPVSDAEIQQEYDKARAQTGDKEYRARHILVENEDQAKAVITDLNKGAKFDELAKKSSKDAGSKDRGGDLDWNVPSAFDKQFSDAMMKLDKGKYTTTPVQTRFGYHIIQLDDVRPVRFPGIEEVKGRIQQQIQQHKVDELVRGLRAKAKVE
ncbi:MAG TPA: peptidylprolyl isomerase [Burkholderiales bacterium]|nr:peptidylprolyl isomerase [Burkholderiales bacterium]